MLEFYSFKEKALWLEQNYDDVHNELIDNSPKVSFVVAINYGSYNECPFKRGQPDFEKDCYKKIWLTVFLGYYQFHFGLRLNKLPYRTFQQYKDYKNAQKTK